MKLQVVRPLFLRGTSHPAGAVVEADALEAATLLESGRAVLVDAADFSDIKAAVTAFNVKATKDRRGIPNPWDRR